MTARAANTKAPRDFNRPYRNIVDKHKQWTMEEWPHFVEAFSPYILSLHPKALHGQMLHDGRLREKRPLLREVTLHHCRVTAGNDSTEARAAAHDKLFKYAKLVSQHFGVKACSYNLHLMVCRYGHRPHPHAAATQFGLMDHAASQTGGALSSDSLAGHGGRRPSEDRPATSWNSGWRTWCNLGKARPSSSITPSIPCRAPCHLIQHSWHIH